MKQALTALLALIVASIAVAVWAQSLARTIPREAQRGEFTHVMQGIVSVNGQQMKLAPGALIYAQNNLTVVPSEVPPNSLVEYTVDRNGDLAKVWILTPAEAARQNPNSSGGSWPADGPKGTPIQRILPVTPSGNGQPGQQ
jgi:hypothetical protein